MNAAGKVASPKTEVIGDRKTHSHNSTMDSSLAAASESRKARLLALKRKKEGIQDDGYD
jgi:hypothetical protein